MRIRLVVRAALPLAVGLGVMVTPVYASGPNPVTIQIHDACNAPTFNTEIGPGTCVGNGAVTFAHFLDEANQVGRAPQWQFVPGQRHVTVDQPFTVTNVGGEVHTFTEVEQFGGGIVPFLNAPAGLTTLAPACTDGTPGGVTAKHGQLFSLTADPTSIVPPGMTISVTEHADDVGHPVLYQCCIHPWMHEVLTVDPN